MRPSILKRERLKKQTRERGLFLHINAPREEPLPQSVQQMIDERIASGQVTVCPPSNRKTGSKRFRYANNP